MEFNFKIKGANSNFKNHLQKIPRYSIIAMLKNNIAI